MTWAELWKRIAGTQGRPDARAYRDEVRAIQDLRSGLRARSDEQLTADAHRADRSRAEGFAVVCEAVRRTLRLELHDVQVVGGLVMADGHIAEMLTGEGKTAAATLPVVWAALGGESVHVLTANEYLARRDAAWMGPVYRLLGLTVGAVGQASSLDERRAAYGCDVTYGSATEIGFDFLRDQLRRRAEDLVQGTLGHALVDEVDSVLIDEARIPLVIAGGEAAPPSLARVADQLVRRLSAGRDFELAEAARRVVLTEAGASKVESELRCGNLFDAADGGLLAAVSQALHAHALLRRDVDYIVSGDSLKLIDEYKGRVAESRRWPEGLQAAVEAKEGLPVHHAGRILGSITLQNFISLYSHVCGMTGTAATQATEFRELYGLEVVAVPPNAPMIREDLPDVVFATRQEKHRAVVTRVREALAAGRPVLVGTASVAESDSLCALLEAADIPHQLLNARNEEVEAAIIRQSGRPDAVTVSTNMAGRGTDIQLGGDPPVDRERVVTLGGLLVLGTNRHESRRVDNQLRGRAGRQGDPGESQFLVSLEDDLFARFELGRETDLDHAQRMIEGQHLDIRLNLQRYERIVELQRRVIHAQRLELLLGEAESLLAPERPDRNQELVAEVGEDELRQIERDVTLSAIDEGWSQYLEEVGQTKEDVAWVSLSGVPLHEYQRSVARMFEVLLASIETKVLDAFATGSAREIAGAALGTGATWTYQTSDQAFPDAMARLVANLRRRLRQSRGS